MTNVISGNWEQFKLPSGKPISRHPPVALFSSFSSSTASSLTQTRVCACWERRGAERRGSSAPWPAWHWLKIGSGFQWRHGVWLGIPLPGPGGVTSCTFCVGVFRVCECELSLCTGSKGRKVSLKQQWQSLKMGHILNKSIPTCPYFCLFGKSAAEPSWWLLQRKQMPVPCFDVKLVLKFGEMNPLEFIGWHSPEKPQAKRLAIQELLWLG